MNAKNIVLALCLLCIGLTSCDDYEEYVKDYEYSAVYFATQKPLRTIVAYDEMKFKVGVALGGKRENSQDEWVTYSIDPSLLDGTDFTLLPDEYYSLSDPARMVVPEGKFIGDVTVTLDKDAFTSDPLAHLNTYALPLRLNETSVDSILSGKFDDQGNQLVPAKDYTILVVKYISPLHGVYYHKGVQKELNAQGETVDQVLYSAKDLSKNNTWTLTTLGLNKVETPGVGAISQGSLVLTKNGDNTVAIEAQGGGVSLVQGTGKYNPTAREFYLDYKYAKSGTTYSVMDTLILRQPPELDLRFEEW